MTNEPVPDFVTYANDLVDKVGERFENALKDTVRDMATKAELKLLEERLANDRQARLEAEDQERAERIAADRQNAEAVDTLRGDLRAEDEKRAKKLAGIRHAVWTVFATLLVCSATIVAALIATHH